MRYVTFVFLCTVALSSEIPVGTGFNPSCPGETQHPGFLSDLETKIDTWNSDLAEALELNPCRGQGENWVCGNKG